MSEIAVLRNGSLEASIAIDFGNIVFSLKSHGREILWTPAPIDEWRAMDQRSMPLGGIPLLAPWANRIDQDAYYANGARYRLNPDLGILWRDGNGLPIHGLVALSDEWRVIARNESSVTSRLEFWRNPKWMAQFPFAHAIEIAHRLDGATLETETAVENLSREPMPLCIGFHPYFSIADAPRGDWSVRIPARASVVVSDKLVPTGEIKPRDASERIGLRGTALDSVFTDLTGEEFVVENRERSVSVRFGPKFPVAVVYAPSDQPLVCFEPMSAMTDAFNLSHAGIDAKLQTVAPGEVWRESFWVKASEV